MKPVDNEYFVNEDPDVLDQAYRRMLGSRGDTMLSEEVKWLAVTHKSFDQGRRGFNDRLAYFGMKICPWKVDNIVADRKRNLAGRRILELQTSLALLSMPRPTQATQEVDASGLIDDMFKQTAFEGLDNVTDHAKAMILNRQRLYNLACEYKLREVTRWKPKKVRNS